MRLLFNYPQIRYYDEIRVFLIWAILKHKQVVCTRRRMLFTILKYLFLF